MFKPASPHYHGPAWPEPSSARLRSREACSMGEWKVPGFTELKALGSGGFGDVVLARNDASGTLVAIKYRRPELLSDPEFAGSFRAEAAVLASLDDPNVVRLYEYAESPAGAAIVMELVEGVSLREMLARQGKTSAEAALVGLQGSLLWAGRCAPPRGGAPGLQTGERASGRGRGEQADRLRHRRAGGGQPAPGRDAGVRAAPEQFAGQPATPASDVYAATATFYECVAGRPPFSGTTAEALLYQHLSEPGAL